MARVKTPLRALSLDRDGLLMSTHWLRGGEPKKTKHVAGVKS
jgi:hypothetical protein